MSLTRKMLRAMGIEDEKIDQIIEAHSETVDALKADRDRYKADADKLVVAQAELDKMQKDGFKGKYEAAAKELDELKQANKAKETRAAKEQAFRELLTAAGIPEKRHNMLVKVSDIDSIELDDKGKAKDAEDRTKALQTDFADFVEVSKTKGVNTATPPASGGSGMTKEEIMKISDRSERRQAIAQHMELFTE